VFEAKKIVNLLAITVFILGGGERRKIKRKTKKKIQHEIGECTEYLELIKQV
jgi:hypothetical protein